MSLESGQSGEIPELVGLWAQIHLPAADADEVRQRRHRRTQRLALNVSKHTRNRLAVVDDEVAEADALLPGCLLPVALRTRASSGAS
jgi:hypothetical protein